MESESPTKSGTTAFQTHHRDPQKHHHSQFIPRLAKFNARERSRSKPPTQLYNPPSPNPGAAGRCTQMHTIKIPNSITSPSGQSKRVARHGWAERDLQLPGAGHSHNCQLLRLLSPHTHTHTHASPEGAASKSRPFASLSLPPRHCSPLVPLLVPALSELTTSLLSYSQVRISPMCLHLH